jgi:hypothetical protein
MGVEKERQNLSETLPVLSLCVFLTIRPFGPPLSYVHYADFFQNARFVRSMFRTAVKTDSAAGSATRARRGQLLHHLLLLQLLLQDSCLARLGEELLLPGLEKTRFFFLNQPTRFFGGFFG